MKDSEPVGEALLSGSALAAFLAGAVGRDVLNELTADGLLSWREVGDGGAEGRVLGVVVPPERLVLLDADGRVLGYGRLSARRLRRQLAGGLLSPQP